MSGDLRTLAEASDAIRRELPEDCGGPHANYSAVFIENAIAKHAPGDEHDANLRRIWRADADFIAAANPEAILALLDERDALAAKVARVSALVDDWADFDHDAAACPKFDCGDCTMLNAIFDLRAALGDHQ